MPLINAGAGDNGLGASPNITITFSQSSTAGVARAVIVFPRGGGAVNTNSVTENSGAAVWTKKPMPTDPYGIGQNWAQVWTPSTFVAGATSIQVVLASNTAGIAFYIEDSSIDPAVGFDTGVAKIFNSNTSVWNTDQLASLAASVIYSVATSGNSASMGFASTDGTTAITGNGITSGHHGNSADGDDAYVARIETGAQGNFTAGISSVTPGIGVCELIMFRKLASAGGGFSNNGRLRIGIGIGV